MFSKYLKSRNRTSQTNASDSNLFSGTQKDKDTSTNEDMQPPVLDPVFLNRTIDIEGTIFSVNDLYSYLKGQGNFSTTQQSLIKAYLANQSSSNDNIFSKYLKATNKTSVTGVLNGNILPEDQDDQSKLAEEIIRSLDPTGKRPVLDSKFLNRTINIEGTIFSVNDLYSYLKGQGNFSTTQESLIKAYFTNQSLSDDNIFSKYLKTTNKTSVTGVLNGNIPPEEQDDQSKLAEEIIRSLDPTGKRPVFDPKFLNRTINIEGTIFSVNDLYSYLEGQGNFSTKERSLIKAYLANQSLSNDNIFTKYLKGTNKTSIPGVLGDNIPFEDQDDQSKLAEEIIRSLNSKFLNRTIDIDGTIFSVNDIRSYLEGKANLTESQKTQIQTYLNKQISTNRSVFSKFLTSTKKPTGTFIPDNNSRLPDSVSKLPLFDSKLYNHTNYTADTIFTEEDVISYLQGRANFTSIQETQIRTYLAQKLFPIDKFSSKYFTSTKRPKRNFTSETHANETLSSDEQTRQEEEFNGPHFNSQHFNRTLDSLGGIFTDDDLQSYLLGTGNLSDSRKEQITAYIKKQLFSNQTIFSKYAQE